MANLNKVFLIGNLTRDPDLRQLPSGTAVCSFGMAINRTMTLASGEQREEVCYVDLTAMGRQAEVIHQYVRKGSPLFVEGRLHFEQWDDRETGKKRNRLTIRVERSQFLGSPQSSQPQGYGAYGGAPSYGQAAGGNQAYGPANQAAPSFAPPPAYGNQPPAYGKAAPSYGAPPAYGGQQSPPPMPAFQPLPENPPPAPAKPTPENPDSNEEIVDDIPF